jgi:hypothetical protein
MQSAEDRRQLVKRYGSEQPGPLVAVLKCAAGILVLVAAAAGPWLFLSPDAAKTTLELPASRMMAKTFPNSMAESKRIFEERRQRHEARLRGSAPAQDGLVAGAEAAGNPAGE